MAERIRRPWMVRSFWIVLWLDILIGLPVVTSLELSPVPQYDLTDGLLLLLIIGILGGAMSAISYTHSTLAYAAGLALALALPVLYCNLYPLGRDIPDDAALLAGHGYFRKAADRALADAIVAGDGPKAVSLVPAVNPNAVGWKDMTFMHLALDKGHEAVDPDIIAALLKGGADPGQDSNLLFGFMTAVPSDANAAIKARNERVLAAVFAAGVDLNRVDHFGRPRFFNLLEWPEGLAEMLDHGAKTEAEDKDGNTAIMAAVWDRNWRSIGVLMAHGARLDHVNHKGTNLREMASVASTWDSPVSPPLAALIARLRQEPVR